jgi:hypothetical protein
VGVGHADGTVTIGFNWIYSTQWPLETAKAIKTASESLQIRYKTLLRLVRARGVEETYRK